MVTAKAKIDIRENHAAIVPVLLPGLDEVRAFAAGLHASGQILGRRGFWMAGGISSNAGGRSARFENDLHAGRFLYRIKRRLVFLAEVGARVGTRNRRSSWMTAIFWLANDVPRNSPGTTFSYHNCSRADVRAI